MANLSITPANVGTAAQGPKPRVVQCGEAVTQGQPLYLNSDGRYYQADANASATAARATAIALTAAGANGWPTIAEGAGHTLNLGATLAVGETYCVSATKGAICPIADLTTGDFPCIIGTAATTTSLVTLFSFAGVAK